VQLVIHPDAKAEIVEAADWYDRRASGLGDEFMMEVDAAIGAILGRPRAWPGWPGAPSCEPPVQRYLLSRFRFYAVAFQTFEDHVLVVAVPHAARRPFYWVQRAHP
jgi:hypothetical protein